jgi:DNA-binding CsgD family transcriptional regulator
MGAHRKTSREATYGPQRHLTLKSRLFTLLRDELGLGRQPKIAQLLCDEIATVVDECFVSEEQLRIGQALVLAVEQGQGNSFRTGLDQVRSRPVRLTLLTPEDISALATGEKHHEVRMRRIARMVKEAFDQGACLTTSQLGLLLGLSPAVVGAHIRAYHQKHEELLPIRGVVEDCSSAVTHKAEIVRLHLLGHTTSEIAEKTHHNPKSVERYLRRFNQVRECVRYFDKTPEPAILARILGIGEKLARAYLELLPPEERPAQT